MRRTYKGFNHNTVSTPFGELFVTVLSEDVVLFSTTLDNWRNKPLIVNDKSLTIDGIKYFGTIYYKWDLIGEWRLEDHHLLRCEDGKYIDITSEELHKGRIGGLTKVVNQLDQSLFSDAEYIKVNNKIMNLANDIKNLEKELNEKKKELGNMHMMENAFKED